MGCQENFACQAVCVAKRQLAIIPSATGSSAAWLARSVRDAEVGGSNPLSPTRTQEASAALSGGIFYAARMVAAGAFRYHRKVMNLSRTIWVANVKASRHIRDESFLVSAREAAWLIMALLVTLPACTAYFNARILDTYDGPFHLFRLMALDTALQSGELYPRWLPNLAFGYGYPLFNYYGPAAYYATELFRIANLNLPIALNLSFALSTLTAAATMYLWLRRHFGALAAFVGATVYTYVPYHLLDGQIRGALAEHWTFAIAPCLLLLSEEVTGPGLERSWRRALPIAFGSIAIALLILTHNLSAPFLLALAAVYLLARVVVLRRRRRVLDATLMLTLGILLAAFYWLPALLELNLVHQGSEPLNAPYFFSQLQPVQDLFTGSLNYDAYAPVQSANAFYPLPIWQGALVVFSAPLILLWIRRGRADRAIALSTSVLGTTGAIFLLWEGSASLWRAVSPLQAIQFPFRVEMLAAIFSAFAASAIVAGCGEWLSHQIGPWRLVLVPPLAMGLLTLGAINLAQLPDRRFSLTGEAITPAAMMRHEAQLGQIGTGWNAEYLPTTVEVAKSDIGAPSREGGGPSSLGVNDRVRLMSRAPLSYTFSVDSAAGFPLLLHQFFFAGWSGRIDGEPMMLQPAGSLGLVEARVPSGGHQLEIWFGSTPARAVGAVLTLLALLLGMISAGVALLPAKRRRFALIALAPMAIAPGPLPGSHLAFVDARVGDLARVVAYQGEATASPGQPLDVVIYWLALKSTVQNYQVFVHLADPKDESVIIAQHDGTPGLGFSPTSRWQAGEILEDSHRITLPSNAKAGVYRLTIGLYDLTTGQALPVQQDGADGGSRVVLQELRITGRP